MAAPAAAAAPTPLHPLATRGFHNAAHYDAHRASYPEAAVDKLLSSLGVAGQENARVVDLACGTGLFTSCLVQRPEGFVVKGVEPHAEMRGVLVRKGVGESQGENGGSLEVLEGDAGNMPIEDGWGDALVAAQAWHWFATEESLKEIHRVLRPGATFGMIWNVEDYNQPKEWPASTTWEQKLKDIINDLEDGQPRFRHLKWKEVFENQLDTNPLQTLVDTFKHRMPLFSLPLGEDDVKWTVWLDDEAVWARYSTLSMIAYQDETKKAEIKQTVFEALKDVPRNEKNEVEVHGVTHLAWTSRV